MIIGKYSGMLYEPEHQPKPQRKARKATAAPTRPMCSRCETKPVHARGRCSTCTRYWNTHREERPYALIKRAEERSKRPLWCKNCGNPKLYTLHRCRACYAHFRKNNVERPERRWNPDVGCLVCGFPRRASPRRKNGHYRFYAGRCEPCHHYLRDLKRERPERLWGIGKHGFCLCGRPANYQKDGFDLCAICADA